MAEQDRTPKYRNPVPTVDIIIELDDGSGIVLIERNNAPHGWAIPGGFVDYGETLEHAAVREAREETLLEVELQELLGVYSDPQRDPRLHTVSTVYIARASGSPSGSDDAKTARAFPIDALPQPLCFDHARILEDYRRYKRDGLRPAPRT